jgi:hypothetical protein
VYPQVTAAFNKVKLARVQVGAFTIALIGSVYLWRIAERDYLETFNTYFKGDTNG